MDARFKEQAANKKTISNSVKRMRLVPPSPKLLPAPLPPPPPPTQCKSHTATNNARRIVALVPNCGSHRTELDLANQTRAQLDAYDALPVLTRPCDASLTPYVPAPHVLLLQSLVRLISPFCRAARCRPSPCWVQHMRLSQPIIDVALLLARIMLTLVLLLHCVAALPSPRLSVRNPAQPALSAHGPAQVLPAHTLRAHGPGFCPL